MTTATNYKADLDYDILKIAIHGGLNGELDSVFTLEPENFDRLALKEIFTEAKGLHSQGLPLTTATILHRLGQRLKGRPLLEPITELLLTMECEKDEAIFLAGHLENYIKRLKGEKPDTFDYTKILQAGCELSVMDIKVETIIDRLIYANAINLFSARGGMGKTILILQASNAITREIPFLGLKTIQRPVVYVDFENSLPTLIDRIKRIGANNVLFWHLSNVVKPPRLDSPDWTQYKKLPKDSVIIFDTLRAAHNSDENSSKEMTLIMNRLKEIRDTGFTIILLHHTPKSNDRTYKGSSAIFDLSDHVLSLYKVKKGSFQELSDDSNLDDSDFCYRFGTQDKTRFEPFATYIEFDSLNKIFIQAQDPDTGLLESIRGLLKDTGVMNQSQICKLVKAELGIKYIGKIVSLLKKGEGRYWSTSPTGLKNSMLYTLI